MLTILLFSAGWVRGQGSVGSAYSFRERPSSARALRPITMCDAAEAGGHSTFRSSLMAINIGWSVGTVVSPQGELAVVLADPLRDEVFAGGEEGVEAPVAEHDRVEARVEALHHRPHRSLGHPAIRVVPRQVADGLREQSPSVL